MSQEAHRTLHDFAKGAPPWVVAWLDELDQFRREEFFFHVAAFYERAHADGWNDGRRDAGPKK